MGKARCEKCGRLLRTNRLRQHRVNGQMWCKACFKKYGENKFYNPNPKRQLLIGKFSMTDNERKVLARTNGWERVNKECKGLKTIKKRVMRKKRQETKQNKMKEKNAKELNKKFVEGLK